MHTMLKDSTSKRVYKISRETGGFRQRSFKRHAQQSASVSVGHDVWCSSQSLQDHMEFKCGLVCLFDCWECFFFHFKIYNVTCRDICAWIGKVASSRFFFLNSSQWRHTYVITLYENCTHVPHDLVKEDEYTGLWGELWCHQICGKSKKLNIKSVKSHDPKIMKFWRYCHIAKR